jgi:hypothetical protein
MPRIYLPLLPLPILAVIVAFSACSRAGEETPATRLIPQAAALPPAPSPAQVPAVVPAAPTGDDAPSAEEVRDFERPVAK